MFWPNICAPLHLKNLHLQFCAYPSSDINVKVSAPRIRGHADHVTVKVDDLLGPAQKQGRPQALASYSAKKNRDEQDWSLDNIYLDTAHQSWLWILFNPSLLHQRRYYPTKTKIGQGHTKAKPIFLSFFIEKPDLKIDTSRLLSF